MGDNLEGIAPGEADLVILNSVSQYFPDADYLARVLDGAVRTVAPGGGSVFIGDVRSRPLLETFAASVERFQAPDLPAEELRRRVRRRVTDEEELVRRSGLLLRSAPSACRRSAGYPSCSSAGAGTTS